MEKIDVMVDMVRYCEVFGVERERNRRDDYSSDYEMMSITPDELKDFIDKGINIKLEE